MGTNSGRWGLVLQVALSAIILLLGFGGMYLLTNRRLNTALPPASPAAPVVQTVTVEPHAGVLDLVVDGVVIPYRDITIAAEVAGRVTFKTEHCRAGHFVKAGERLFQIDDQNYRLEVQRLEKQVEQAAASLEVLDVELANTDALIESGNEELKLQQAEVERLQRLRGRAVADSDVDAAKRSEWASRNALLGLRNQILLIKSRRRGLDSALDLAKSQLEKARLDLARTTITSPIDGVIVRDVVEQDSFVQSGAELLTIEDTSRAEVKCNLQMDELAWIWRQRKASAPSPPEQSVPNPPVPPSTNSPFTSVRGSERQPLVDPDGDPAKLAEVSAEKPHPADLYELPTTPATIVFQPLGSDARYQWQGVLSRFDGLGIDGKTRTVPCRITVTNRKTEAGDGESVLRPVVGGPPALLRGMYVSVVLHANPDAQLLRVPEIAIQPGKKLYRMTNHRVDMLGPVRTVQLVSVADERGAPRKVWLLDAVGTDLRAGDLIITSPLPAAFQGMEVRTAADE